MSATWLTIKAAAERLKVSERTVWRRLRAGELETRKTPDGVREVAIESPLTPADNLSDALSVVEQQGERQIQVAGAAVGQARELSKHLTDELHRTRRTARVAWSIAAVLTIGVGVGLWASARLLGALELEQARAASQATTIEQTVDRLAATSERAQALGSQVDALSVERDRLRDAREALVEQRADALVDLAGAKARTATTSAELTVAKAEIDRLTTQLEQLAANPPAPPTDGPVD